MRPADEDPNPGPGAPALGDPDVTQADVNAERDAYVAGRDIYVNAAVPEQPPGAHSKAWGNVPPRNPAFAGRDQLMLAVRTALTAGSRRAAIQALHGMGGIGKTQLALEYVHRHADDYDIVWWFDAENTSLLAEQFAAMAIEFGLARRGTPIESVRRAILGNLRFRERWLLVFDNAASAASVASWLPSGPGHVLITSRSAGWSEVAVPVEVDVLARDESVGILRGRVGTLTSADADLVAAAAGDLPLALGHAADYLLDTGMSADRYVMQLRKRSAEILGTRRAPSYPSSLAAITLLALDRLHELHSPSADLVRICAFLAPEPVPADWFSIALLTAADRLPGSLAASLADESEQARMLARLARSGLVRVEPTGLVMHRLTQAIIRTALPPEQATGICRGAEAVITANVPEDPEQPAAWATYARIVLHILHVLISNADEPDSPTMRDAAVQGAWYLLHRGDARAGHSMAGFLYVRWRNQSGQDDHHALKAADALAVAMRQRGEYAEACALSRDVLNRRQAHFGDDHKETLAAASHLAAHLRAMGDSLAARDLDEDTLTKLRRDLGNLHPRSLAAAHSLAIDHHLAGEHGAARDLNRETLDRRKAVLGNDHPETLASASNLAANLHELGDYQVAQELNGDTLARRRRVLGDDHPDTLSSANNLAANLRALGDYRSALYLDLDTLRRRIMVLGKDHADARQSAVNVDRDRAGLRPGQQVVRILTRRRSGLVAEVQHLDFTLSLDQYHRSMLAKQIAARIEAEMSAWSGPGSERLECIRLPSRKHLARRHGVSRAVIRDAVKILRGLGPVPVHGHGDSYLFRMAIDAPRRGISVAPGNTRPWLDSTDIPVPPPSEPPGNASLPATAILLVKTLARAGARPHD